MVVTVLFTFSLRSVGEGKPKEVEHGPVLKKNLLDTHNCFLLDAGNEMFVWMGRETTLEQRKAATLSAEVLDIVKFFSSKGFHSYHLPSLRCFKYYRVTS